MRKGTGVSLRANDQLTQSLVRPLDTTPGNLIQTGPGSLDNSQTRHHDDFIVARRDRLLALGTEVSLARAVQLTHVKTTPRNRCPTLIAVHRPCRASFLPLHRRGSQWSKSHIATGTATRTSCCSSSSASEPEPEPDSSSSEVSSSSVVSLSSSSSDPKRQFECRPLNSPTMTGTGLSRAELLVIRPPPLGPPRPRPPRLDPPRPRPLPRVGGAAFFALPGLPMIEVCGCLWNFWDRCR